MRKLAKQENGGDQNTPQTSFSPLWTRRQVAEALQLCVHSVARYSRDGLLPCIKLNQRVVRYDPDVVRSFIKSGRVRG